MFVRQPNEEGTDGAKTMLADGLFTRFPKPDFDFALHFEIDAAGTFGKTVVITTHDPAVALRGDRVLHMRDGRF